MPHGIVLKFGRLYFFVQTKHLRVSTHLFYFIFFALAKSLFGTSLWRKQKLQYKHFGRERVKTDWYSDVSSGARRHGGLYANVSDSFSPESPAQWRQRRRPFGDCTEVISLIGSASRDPLHSPDVWSLWVCVLFRNVRCIISWGLVDKSKRRRSRALWW